MLTVQKHKELIGCLTSIARKVYDSVPKDVSLSVRQILTDMQHQTGIRSDIRIVIGCLNTMTDSGLVLNDGQDNFKRAPVRIATSITDLKVLMTTKPEPNKEDKQFDPLICLLQLAKDMRAQAALIEEYVAALDAKVNAPSAELVELRAMRDMLKKITS